MRKYIIIGIALLAILSGLNFFLMNLKRNQILTDYGLKKLAIEELIEKLENDQFPQEVRASIFTDNLNLKIGGERFVYRLPNDLYYLSFAPYMNHTHECFIHSLTGCQGEIINQDILIKIYDEENNLLNEITKNTGSDGFIGLFLTSTVNYRIEVEHAELKSVFYANAQSGQTCFTEVKLI